MCGRATLTAPDLKTVAHLAGAEFDAAEVDLYRPRYNLAPTNQHWIVRQDESRRQLQPARWGLAGKVRPLLINVRAETVATKFRTAFQGRRCLVPVDGFYEWTGTGKSRHPVWFHSPQANQLLLLAGLYEERQGGTQAFTVITCAPNKLVAPVHDRMPVIVSDDKVAEWLTAPALYLLAPAVEESLVATEVSNRANSVAYDDPECLVPLVSAQKGQLSLL